MILVDVLLLLHCWLKEIYFHRYVNLSLSQQVLRFSVLLQAPQNVSAGLHCHCKIVT